MNRDDLDGGMFGMTGMTKKTRMTWVTGVTTMTSVNKITGAQWDNWDDYACEYSCLSSLPAARNVLQERHLLLNERNSTLMMQISVSIM